VAVLSLGASYEEGEEAAGSHSTILRRGAYYGAVRRPFVAALVAMAALVASQSPVGRTTRDPLSTMRWRKRPFRLLEALWLR
jgi:hypothetical protein